MTTEHYSRALVTGATSGIGAATSRALAAEGLEVLAVGRRKDQLATLAREIGCKTLASDVRAVESMTTAIASFKPDIVVNNAGVGDGISGLPGMGPDDIADAIGVNVIAPIQIAAAAIDVLKQTGARGHIITIGSIAGLHTLISALYGAGKAAMHIFSQNLRFELKGLPIRVTEICPGRTATEFYGAAKGDEATLATMAQSGISELQPEDIAAAVLFALKAPLHVNISTIEILPTEQAVGGTRMTPLPEL